MDVRIVYLGPMRAACTNAFGITPEADAWAALLAWAEPRGLLATDRHYRLFGYDNPPANGNGLHGYDTWITVGPAVRCRPEEQVRIREFEGGSYAVTRCVLADVVDTWTRLHEWVLDSPCRPGGHQWLEEYLTMPRAPWQEILLDLYHPIREPGRSQ